MQQRHKIISFVLLLLIGFYLGGSTLFIHSHTIEGVSVVHSHPFSGNPSSHSHGNSSVDTILRLSNMDGVVAECVTLNNSSEFTIEEQNSSHVYILCGAPTAYSPLRAPPVIG